MGSQFPRGLFSEYAYANGNPLNRIDADGHASWKPCKDDSGFMCFTGDYNGERWCGSSDGCLFWNDKTNQWEKNDANAPSASDLPGWWFTGFIRLSLGEPYGLKQMGYAYGKVALLSFGGWKLLKPPGVDPNEAGGRPAIVPEDWTTKPTYKNNGVIYIDPDNPHNSVRVMDDGYMKVQKNGQYLDKNLNQVPGDSPVAHIPVDTPMESPFNSGPIDIPIVE